MKDIKQFACSNGVAVGNANIDHDKFTFACSPELNGVYGAEMFGEPVYEWCIHVPMGHAFWAKTTKEVADKWNIDFPNSKRKTRLFLHLKSQPMPEQSPEKKGDNNGWVEIKSYRDLPKTYCDVIIYGKYTSDCPMQVYEATFNPKGGKFTRDAIRSKNVTHWMLLPKPPKQN